MDFKDFVAKTILVPLGNILIPPQRMYPDTIEKYKKSPPSRLPKGVIDDGKKFPQWRFIKPRLYHPAYPKVYITDGVHRILAQMQLHQKAIRVELEDGKFY